MVARGPAAVQLRCRATGFPAVKIGSELKRQVQALDYWFYKVEKE
jgi:hypothetical protein